MNLIEFTKILSMPSSISKEQSRGLYEVLKEYPYFQSAYFMRLYALKKYRSFRYNDALKKTAAYTTDRSLLFDYITSFDFDFHPAPANLIEEEKIEEEKKDALELDDEKKPIETEPEEVLKLGEPLNFSKEETYSFGQWLQLGQLRPIERKQEKKTKKKTKITAEKPKSNMDLISDFITKSPKITASLSDSYDDMARESAQENKQLMTETLAHVYVEQKKYDKAIAAFTILSLKYPEKSSLFADRIEAIKKLQNN